MCVYGIRSHCLYVVHSISVREDSPSTFYALRTKLLAVPCSSGLRGNAQVNSLEEDYGSNGFIQRLTWGCSSDCESKVYHTLARIMRRDDATKQSFLRQRVLFETSEIGVARVLGY